MTFVSEFRDLLKGALVLDTATFESLRDDPDGFARGLKFLVSMALLVGLVLGLVQFLTTFNASTAEQMAEAQTAMDQMFEQMLDFGAFGDEADIEQAFDSIREGFAIAARVGEVVDETTAAPTFAVRLFESLAKWLSQPFSWISLWLTWGLITLVFARLLGGTATVQQMLATSSLVAAPHILDALGFVPCGGAVFQTIAFFWGLFVYVKATTVANRFSSVWIGALAAFAPILLLLLFLFLAVLLLVLLVAVAS